MMRGGRLFRVKDPNLLLDLLSRADTLPRSIAVRDSYVPVTDRKPQDMKRGGHFLFRRNATGVVLARGPLDYDVPVRHRCGECERVYTAPLASPCPHCAADVRGAA